MKYILKKELDEIKKAGLYRKLKVIASAPGRTVKIEGREYINFSSNNYLGLAQHPAVVKAAADALQLWGAGSTSSRLVAGTFDIHKQLEERLANLKNTEACISFPAGFQANTGVISTLTGDGDCIIMDRLNHASLWDGAKLSGARIFVYPHKEMAGLEKILKRAQSYRRRLVITDSVFSMDGDFAPLPDIVNLAARYGAWTMIDEAHATGIFGEQGSGLAEHFGLEGKIDIVMGTLSKALGSQGAFICGSSELIEYLINKCRPFIYTTALSPVCAAAALESLDIIKREPERRRSLLGLSKGLRAELKAAGFDICSSESQIVPCVTGPVQKTLAFSDRLLQNGIYAPAIRPPTVPEGACRLRFSLTSEHTEEDIKILMKHLKE